MFRKMLRNRQELSEAECRTILRQEKRGVMAVLGDADYPYAVPLNHYYCEEDGKLYFHGGRQGHRIDAVKRHPKASFCVFDQGVRGEGDWALTFRSVIVFGHIEFVEDREKTCEIARALSLKFTRDTAYIEDEIARSGPRTLLFALVPEHMTGKRVREA